MAAMFAWLALMGIPTVALALVGVWVYKRETWRWSRVAGVLIIVLSVVMIAFTIVGALGFSTTTEGGPY